MGSSTSQASYAFQLGSDFVDYFITSQHHCVQQIDNSTRCRTQGSFVFTPRTEVLVTAEAFYNYHMPTDPMIAGAGVSVLNLDMPSGQQTVLGDGNTIQSFFGPATGTIPLSASGILQPGFRYRMSYSAIIFFLGGQPSTATGDAMFHLRVTEIPEPAALGPLALGALLVRARRCRHRRA